MYSNEPWYRDKEEQEEIRAKYTPKQIKPEVYLDRAIAAAYLGTCFALVAVFLFLAGSTAGWFMFGAMVTSLAFNLFSRKQYENALARERESLYRQFEI